VQERYTVAGVLRSHAEERAEAPMLTLGETTVTWSEEHKRAATVAQAFRAEGVAAGDRVAFLDRNGIPYFDTLFGATMLGAVHVAVNWRLSPEEMAAIIDDSRASVLVVSPEFLDCLDQIESGLTDVKRVVVLGDDSGMRGVGASLGSRLVPETDWTSDHDARDPGFVGGPGHVCMQLYTSGTTGLPKGVMLTNANMAHAMGEATETFSIDKDVVSLVAMPLFHIGGSGWALCAMSRGGRSVILREVDPCELLRLVEYHRITDAFLVPAVLMFLLATPDIAKRDLSSLRNIFYGASPIAEDVLVRCMEVFGCDFTQVYGMTETTGAITALRSDDHDPDGPRRHLLRSAGRPLAGVELRVVDPDTKNDVSIGDVGELWTRSPYNMLGYWEKPEETRKTIDENGWLATGDACYMDDDGYVYLHDRIKDMIISGGENIYPAEVENVLLAKEGVSDAAVIGVPHELWGETVKAIVVISFDAKPDEINEAAIVDFCRERLAHYKCPTSVDFASSLPRNPSGKLLKRELRAPYWEGNERLVH